MRYRQLCCARKNPLSEEFFGNPVVLTSFGGLIGGGFLLGVDRCILVFNKWDDLGVSLMEDLTVSGGECLAVFSDEVLGLELLVAAAGEVVKLGE